MRERTDRRRLLATVALIAPASLLPTVAVQAAEPDPHPAWEREWRACLDFCNAPGVARDRDLEEVPEYQRLGELEQLLWATPARSLVGAVAQLRVLAYWHRETGGLVEGDLDGLANAIATLERLAGRGS